MSIGKSLYDVLQAFGACDSEVESCASRFLFIHKQGSGGSGYCWTRLTGHSARCPGTDSARECLWKNLKLGGLCVVSVLCPLSFQPFGTREHPELKTVAQIISVLEDCPSSTTLAFLILLGKKFYSSATCSVKLPLVYLVFSGNAA